MTQEEKQLLLIDLSGRLFYGVLLQVKGKENEPHKLEVIADDYSVCFTGDELFGNIYLNDIKPYLRPLSSMTEEERKSEPCGTSLDGYMYSDEAATYVDWLNEHHFDHRGLIEKGLALEAPENMYKTE